MENKMENYKEGGRLSRRFSSRKRLGSLKTRLKRFLSDRHVKAGEGEGHKIPATGSDLDVDGRKISSNSPLERSGEIEKSSGSGFSSDSDEESPSKLETMANSDPSSDSSEEKKKKKVPSKSSRKKLKLQEDRQEFFRLPPLEETPPTSPQSNPRFSTEAQNDFARLWTHTSAPNSPANLAYNFNLNYRGGVSSPVALVHSLSSRNRGKHPSQLSEIAYASPPSSSSLDLDVLGVKLEDMTASPTKTTPSLKPNGLPVVHHDEEQGVWRCGSCGWIYPNPNPSLRNRREHENHCGELSKVQRWLGAQDIQDAPGKGAVESEEDSEVWEGSGSQATVSTADKTPMGEIDGEDSNEPDRPVDHYGSVDQGRLDDMESNDSPDHAIGDEGQGGRSSSAAAKSDEVENQKLNGLREWPSLDARTKDQIIGDEMLSNGSSNNREVTDQSKLEDVSTGSNFHYGIEEFNKLDDSASFIIPEVENEKDVEVQAGQDHDAYGDEGNRGKIPDAAANLDEVEDQQLNRVPEWPTVDVGTKDQSSADKMLSKGSSNLHDVMDQSKLEDVSNGSNFHYGIEEFNKLDDSASFITPEAENEKDVEVQARQDHDAYGDEGNRGRIPDAAANLDEDQQLNRVPERPTVDVGTKDQSSADKMLSNGSSNLHDVMDQSKLEDVSNGSTAYDGIEGVRNLDDAASFITRESENEKEVEVQADQEHDTFGDEVNGRSSPNSAANPGEVEDQKLNRLPERPSLHAGTNDQSSADEMLSNGSSNRHEVTDHLKLEDVSNGLSGDHGIEEVSKLDDSASFLTPEAENVKGVEVRTDQNHDTFGDEGKDGKSPNATANLDEVEDQQLNRVPEWLTLDAGTRDQSSADEMPTNGSANHHAVSDHKMLKDVSNVSLAHDGIEEVNELDDSSPEVESEKDDSAEVKADQDHDAVGDGENGGLSPRAAANPDEVDYQQLNRMLEWPSLDDGTKDQSLADETLSSGSTNHHEATDHSKLEDRSTSHHGIEEVSKLDDAASSRTPEVENDGAEAVEGKAEQEDINGNVESSHASIEGFREDGNANRDFNDHLNHPDDIGLTEVPEVRREGSVLTSDTGVRGEEGIENVRNEDDLDNQLPGDDGLSEEAVAVKAVETEPRIITHKGRPIVLAGVVREPDLMDPSLSRAELQCSETETERRDTEALKSVASEVKNMDMVIPKWTEIPNSQNSCLEPEEDTKADGIVSDERSEQKVSEGDGVEGNSTRELPSQENGITTENGWTAGGPPSPFEEAPKSVNSLITSQDDGDTSLPMEKYWADIEEDGAEITKPMPGRTGHVHGVPLDEDESVSSYLQRSEQEPPVKEEAIEECPSGVSTIEFHLVDELNKEGTSESSPVSVPAFHQDLPASLGVLSSHEEITSVIDRPETSLTQEPQALKDANERGSYNCLPDLVPAFSCGPIPVHNHPPVDMDESAGMEQHEEPIAGSGTRGGTASLTQEPQALKDAEEKGSWNCLSVLLPALRWGPIPVFTHPPPDTYEFSGEGQYEEAPAGSPSVSETQEPQAPEDGGENRSSNCLTGLLRTFSWRSSPQAPTGRINEVPVDDDEDLQSSHLEAKEWGTCACLPLLFPAFHWGFTRTTYGKGLQEPLLPQDPPAAGAVPLDNTSTHAMQTTDPWFLGTEVGVITTPLVGRASQKQRQLSKLIILKSVLQQRGQQRGQQCRGAIAHGQSPSSSPSEVVASAAGGKAKTNNFSVVQQPDTGHSFRKRVERVLPNDILPRSPS